MADKKLVKVLQQPNREPALTSQAAQEILRLEAELQRAVNERNEAWFALESKGLT